MRAKNGFGFAMIALLAGGALYGAMRHAHAGGTRAPRFRVSLEADGLSALDRERLLGPDGSFEPGEAAFLPPGGGFEIELAGGAGPLSLAERAAWLEAGGTLARERPRLIQGTAPRDFGVYRFRATDEAGEVCELAAVVLIEAERVAPAKKDRLCALAIEGEKLGDWPDPARAAKSRRVRAHPERYAPPRFFARITPETESLRLAGEVTLGQMVGFIGNKREGEGTKRHTHVFPPSRPLIRKLDRLGRALRADGLKFQRIEVTSGFRTPRYNASIGGTSYSRHIYGDAADLYIDDDGDERMDDLTGDRKADRADALLLANALRALESGGRAAAGGIGVYEYAGPDSARASVHADCRGFVTRWGSVPARRGKRAGLKWWPPEEFKEEEEEEER